MFHPVTYCHTICSNPAPRTCLDFWGVREHELIFGTLRSARPMGTGQLRSSFSRVFETKSIARADNAWFLACWSTARADCSPGASNTRWSMQGNEYPPECNKQKSWTSIEGAPHLSLPTVQNTPIVRTNSESAIAPARFRGVRSAGPEEHALPHAAHTVSRCPHQIRRLQCLSPSCYLQQLMASRRVLIKTLRLA